MQRPKDTRGRFVSRPLIDRFEERYEPVPESGCWVWTGARYNKFGYGCIVDGGKSKLAHRVAYELFCGPIPHDLCVLHTCDNPSCVNPAHLFTGTHGDNMRDKMAKGRDNTPRGEAVHNSKLTEDDVRRIKAMDGTRRSIAAKFGVTPECISAIKLGRIWKHVEEEAIQE